MENAERGRSEKSVFWPIMLIGIGVIWLLGEFNVITSENLSVLGRIWPLLLIVLGIDILLGRQSKMVSAVLGIGTIVLVVVLILIGPSIGLSGDWDFTFNIGPWTGVGNEAVQTQNFTEALNEASSVSVNIEMPFEHLTVGALRDSNNLIEADVDYIGDMTFDVSGGSDRRIRLSENTRSRNYTGGRRLAWNVRLNPDVPLDLALDLSSGEADVDLSALQVSSLDVNLSSGSARIDIPDNAAFNFRRIELSSGSVRVNVGENASFTVDVSLSSGSVVFDVPDDAAVQVNVDRISSGSVNMPRNYALISGREGEEGTWQSEGFDAAERRIVLHVGLSSGSVAVR